MKIKEIAQKVDKSEKNSVWIDIQEFGEEFGLGYCDYKDEDINVRLKVYYFHHWYCTDSYVGHTVIFFDDEFVGMSRQLGRKCDTTYSWTSNESYQKVKDYVVSLIVNDSDDGDPDLVDFDEDWGDGYKLAYVGQPLKNPYYNGKEIEIENRGKMYENFHTVYIKGTDTSLQMNEISFKYNLKDLIENE